jgi:hypothetical protein
MPLLARLLVCQAIANDTDSNTALIDFATLVMTYLPDYVPKPNPGDSDHEEEVSATASDDLHLC